MKKNFLSKSCLMLLLLSSVTIAATSCKAVRTIHTTATYSLVTDSTKSTTTIQSKTVEEYTGVKK